MNKFQLTVLIAALANLALMFLFPPFNGQSLLRAGPASFDAFYPAFDAPANATLNSGLLYLEIFSVLVNAVLAWLLLQSAPQEPSRPRVRWQSVLQWLVIANLLLILLFRRSKLSPTARSRASGSPSAAASSAASFCRSCSWSCFCWRSMRRRCGWHLDSSLAGARRTARNPPLTPNRLLRRASRPARTEARLGAATATGGR